MSMTGNADSVAMFHRKRGKYGQEGVRDPFEFYLLSQINWRSTCF